MASKIRWLRAGDVADAQVGELLHQDRAAPAEADLRDVLARERALSAGAKEKRLPVVPIVRTWVVERLGT